MRLSHGAQPSFPTSAHLPSFSSSAPRTLSRSQLLKMGFFSKKDKEAEDPNRNALFGNRKASPAPSSTASSGGSNPYAASIAPSTAPSTAPPSYRSNYAPSVASTAGSDANRDALFGGRKTAPPSTAAAGYGGGGQGGYGAPAGAGRGTAPGAAAAGYGDYDKADRQLTAEEEEEEDVDAVKQQIRFTKQESVASTRNALRVAAQAEETGRNTLARLGAQGERLYNTEKNLDIAASHNRRAEEKARELKTLNGSMFAIHMKNPMRSKARAAEEEDRILSRHQSEREEREQTRQAGFQGRQHVDGALRGGYKPSVGGRGGASMAERSKYQFEADDSDDEKEREIDANLGQLGAITNRLHGLAVATNAEVDRQNAQIDKISKKVRSVSFLLWTKELLADNTTTERPCRRSNRDHAQQDKEDPLNPTLFRVCAFRAFLRLAVLLSLPLARVMLCYVMFVCLFCLFFACIR